MQREPFAHPAPRHIENAYQAGFHSRAETGNPYITDPLRPTNNLLAWAWDLGRRTQRLPTEPKQFDPAAPLTERASRFRSMFGGAS